jgi:hypothetical protein
MREYLGSPEEVESQKKGRPRLGQGSRAHCAAARAQAPTSGGAETLNPVQNE